MRDRLDGKTVPSLHAPQTPTTRRPTTSTVRPRPWCQSHSTLAIESTPHPVGLATVAPRPAGLHPEVKSDHQSRGLAGNGRNSPTVGTLWSIIVRLARRMNNSTDAQAIVVLSGLSRQRRTVADSPMYVSVSRARR